MHSFDIASHAYEAIYRMIDIFITFLAKPMILINRPDLLSLSVVIRKNKTLLVSIHRADRAIILPHQLLHTCDIYDMPVLFFFNVFF